MGSVEIAAGMERVEHLPVDAGSETFYGIIFASDSWRKGSFSGYEERRVLLIGSSVNPNSVLREFGVYSAKHLRREEPSDEKEKQGYFTSFGQIHASNFESNLMRWPDKVIGFPQT